MTDRLSLRSTSLLLALAFALTGCAHKAHIPAGDIVFLGDSITSGYGLNPSQAYPWLIHIPGMSTVNLGVPGNKSADGLQRLKDYFGGGNLPVLVVIELGANDFLQNVPHDVTTQNLTDTIHECQKRQIPVLLCGVHIPGKYGTSRVFSQAAGDTGAVLLPDILEGMENDDSLYQDDGHPTASGQQRIADKVQAALLKSFVFPGP